MPRLQPSASTISADAQAILEKATNSVLTGNAANYDSARAGQRQDQITQQCIDELRGLSPWFKFIVQCVLLENVRGSDLQTHTLSQFDDSTDECIHYFTETGTTRAWLTCWIVGHLNH